MTLHSLADTYKHSKENGCSQLQGTSVLKTQTASPAETLTPIYHTTHDQLNSTFITERTSSASVHSCLLYFNNKTTTTEASVHLCLIYVHDNNRTPVQYGDRQGCPSDGIAPHDGTNRNENNRLILRMYSDLEGLRKTVKIISENTHFPSWWVLHQSTDHYTLTMISTRINEQNKKSE